MADGSWPSRGLTFVRVEKGASSFPDPAVGATGAILTLWRGTVLDPVVEQLTAAPRELGEPRATIERAIAERAVPEWEGTRRGPRLVGWVPPGMPSWCRLRPQGTPDQSGPAACLGVAVAPLLASGGRGTVGTDRRGERRFGPATKTGGAEPAPPLRAPLPAPAEPAAGPR